MAGDVLLSHTSLSNYNRVAACHLPLRTAQTFLLQPNIAIISNAKVINKQHQQITIPKRPPFRLAPAVL
jgi:hypothetical protein